MKSVRKYRNEPTTYNKIRYASALEARTAQWLDMMMKAGEVKNWTSQPLFGLFAIDNVPANKVRWDKANILVGNYRADFSVVFTDGHKEVWECKSKPTRTALYQLKLKILKANYPHLIHREITQENLPKILR